MLPFGVHPFDLHPQGFCEALPPAEMLRGVSRTPPPDGPEQAPSAPSGLLQQPQRPSGRVVVGCVTPVLCRLGAIACAWPACCGKTRR